MGQSLATLIDRKDLLITRGAKNWHPLLLFIRKDKKLETVGD